MSADTLEWPDAWAALGLTPPDGLHQALLTRYAEPHRAYHDLRHIVECIGRFREARHVALRPAEVALAIWFHDAVYEPPRWPRVPLRSDNEARSADWARDALLHAGAEPEVAARVFEAILATRAHAVAAGADVALLLDIDLAILGAPPARFDEYQAQIRREYRGVPGTLFRRRRSAMLRGLLERPAIFQTAFFRERLEDAARRNLLGALASPAGC